MAARLAFPQPIAPSLIRLNVLGQSFGRALFAGTGLQQLVEAQTSALARAVFPSVIGGLRLPVVRWDAFPLREMTDRISEPIRALIPDNLHGLRIEEWPALIGIGAEHRIGLAWSPRPEVVRGLLDAPEATDREMLLARHYDDILTDCAAVVADIEHPAVRELAGFLIRAVDAVRDGHEEAGQALATNVLDTALRTSPVPELRHPGGVLRDLAQDADDETTLRSMRLLISGCGIPRAYQHYPPGDSSPDYSRHGTVHCANALLYSRTNALKAIMLTASWLRLLSVEAPLHTEPTA